MRKERKKRGPARASLFLLDRSFCFFYRGGKVVVFWLEIIKIISDRKDGSNFNSRIDHGNRPIGLCRTTFHRLKCPDRFSDWITCRLLDNLQSDWFGREKGEIISGEVFDKVSGNINPRRSQTTRVRSSPKLLCRYIE